jgi:hypothetical protein
MNRRLGWAILVAVGVLLGYASNICQRSIAAPVAAASAEIDPQQAEIVAQLKEVKAELKQLNAMFRTGNARVTVVINPTAP